MLFECPKSDKKFVIRPYIGGVNGITGESTVGDMTSIMRRMFSRKSAQDYVRLPQQKWLDGIATAPGLVKQFIATPMVPPDEQAKTHGLRQSPRTRAHDRQCDAGMEPDSSEAQALEGASLEWQMTGRDSVGGIQLQIIPQHKTKRMFFGNFQDVIYTQRSKWKSYTPEVSEQAQKYDVLKTPRELGISAEGTIHMKNIALLQEPRQKLIKDLLSECPMSVSQDGTLDLDVYYRADLEFILHVGLMQRFGVETSLKVIHLLGTMMLVVHDGLLGEYLRRFRCGPGFDHERIDWPRRSGPDKNVVYDGLMCERCHDKYSG